jgi:multidrug efflux pump
MNISAAFIKRPVATTLLTVGITLVGAIAFKVLPVSPLPQVDFPTISVSAGLPGGSPEIMASSIATPLERQFSHVAGVTEMTSSSSLGSTSITLQFDLSRNIDGAARDVEAAINAARTYLPANLPGNPTYRKVNPADSPIMILGLTSDKYDKPALYDYASSVIAQKLSQLQGVGQVSVGGGAGPSVRVEVNPTLLNSHGLTMSSVQAMLSQQNVHEAVGQIADSDGRKLDIITNDQMHLADDYKPLVVGYHNGQAVRLSDVADVENGAQNIRASGYMDGIPSITVIIFRQPGANIIETNDRIQAELPSVQASIPQGIKVTMVLDRTTTIRASVNDVERSLVLSVVLVVLVVFMFLRSWRATLIPFVAVPASLIATFAVMYLLGFSIDNLSLMALTISTGFVVDDAIVVMENISRLREDGMSPMKAAFEGSRQIGFTIFSISMSLIAVFIPILLMAGIVGRLFREFAITLSTAIIMSMLVSLTTTPMMCAYILKDESKIKHGRIYRASEKGFSSLLSGYSRTLRWVLNHPWPVFVILLLTIALNFYLIAIIPKGFFPQQDTGQLQGGIRGDATSSFQLMKRKLQDVAAIIGRDPAVKSLTGSVGGGGFGPFGGGGANANVSVTLKPLSERGDSADQVIARLRPQLSRVAGVATYLQAVQDFGGGGGRSANSQYQYTLLGDDLTELRNWSQKIRVALQDVPELTDVDTDQQPGGLEADLIVDRDSASRLGLTEIQIDNALGDAFAQAQVSTIYNPFSPQQYHVVMEVAPEYWQNPEVLKKLYVSTSGGSVTGTQSTQAVAGTAVLRSGTGATANSIAADTARNLAANSLANAGRGNTSTGSAVSVASETVVPFSAFSHFSTGTTPVSVNHTGTSVSTSIAFNLPERESLGVALAAIERTMNQIHVPVSIRGASYGTARLFQQSVGSLPLMLAAALLAIYVVLGMLYESFSQPLTILSTLPSAGVGALLALLATRTEFSLIAFLGILLLIGIVKKNAIMMVDFALDAERNLGMDPRTAIAHACSLRFRPIMMTTCAAIAGALPLAIASGDGTEMRRPLGISIVGGLVLSQLLTVYTTPVVYLYVHRYWKRGKRAAAPAFPDAGPPVNA